MKIKTTFSLTETTSKYLQTLICLLLVFFVSAIHSQTSTTITSAGTSSFTIPAGVTKVVVKAWGAGGGGGGSTSNGKSGGGGGGGAYTTQTFTGLVPTTNYNNSIVVGDGGNGGATGANDGFDGGNTTVTFTSTVTANGGKKGTFGQSSTAGLGGAGGTAGTFAGGAGSGGGSAGAGGGGSAGTGSIGNTASGGAAAAAVTGGGPGGAGGSPVGQSPVSGPGGGGGGGDRTTGGGATNGSGGKGFAGQVILEYFPEYTLASNAQSPGNLCTSVTNSPIHSFSLTGLNNGGVLTGLTFVTTGTYAASEITNFKLYYTATNSFSTGTLLATISSPAVAGTQTFPSFSQTIGNTTGYLWITMDVASSVTDGRTITVSATSTSNLTSSTSNIILNGSATASNTATLKASAGSVAGTAINTCYDAGAVNITAGSSASIYSSITWSCDGTGTFSNANSLTTCTYTPSNADSIAGSRTLTLTVVSSNGCSDATSTKTITISPSITVSAGSALSAVCQGATTVALGGTFGGSATSAVWSDGGAGGSFANNGGATPNTATYTASMSSPSSVTLTITATASCGTKTATKSLSVTPTVGTPTFSLGTTSNRCYGAGTITYTATSSNNTGLSYSLDNTSVAAGNSINSTTGEVTFASNWIGSSIITASATGCNGPVTNTHTVTTLSSVSSPAFIDVH
jgi:hypothetical protein